MGRGLSTRRLAGCALVGIAVYLVLDVALVFLRPQFSVLHNAESDYGSTGRYAWVMDANFLLRCALSLAAAWALVRVLPLRFRTAFWFLVVWALASGLLAFFPDDPVGTRTRGPAKVHLLLALIAFAAVIVGTLLASRVIRRTPGWERVAPALTVISWLAIVPILLLGHAKLRPRSLGGLWEKTLPGARAPLACRRGGLDRLGTGPRRAARRSDGTPPPRDGARPRRATGWATERAELPGQRRSRSGGRRGGRLLREAPRGDLGDALRAHRDAVEDVGRLHRALLVGDDDELRLTCVGAQQPGEAADVRVVEGSLDLVEEVEGARPGEEEREQEGDRAESLLAA